MCLISKVTAFSIDILDNLARDGGGSIDAPEISEMVRGLFAMSGLEVRLSIG